MKTATLLLLPLLLIASRSHAEVSAAQIVNEGGVRLFAAVEKNHSGNLCLSPYSIQVAMAMTYAGARDSTKAQMAKALDFPEDAAALAKAFGGLDAGLLTSLKRGCEGSSLHIANRLFGATGFAFRPVFLDLLKASFSAPLEELDFEKNPPAAAGHINAWVEKQTEKRIQNLIPRDALTKETTLVLVNALYLKMPWAEEFVAAATKPQPFAVPGKGSVEVPTMERTDSFGYAEADGFQAVSLPFRGGEFQLLLLLPQATEGAPLPTSALLEKCARLPRRSVGLFLPKFKLEPPTIPLGEALQSLGILAAFDIPLKSANFDGMAPRHPDDYLFLSEVFHKTFFALDEKGVEAAAATAVVMMRALAMPVQEDPIEVRMDRPFFFAIQHVPSSACLFLGRVSDPR